MISSKSRLKSISLLTNSKTIFAAALTKFRKNRSITSLNSVNSLKTTHTNLTRNLSNSILQTEHTSLNSFNRSIKHLSKSIQIIKTTIHNVSKILATFITVYRCKIIIEIAITTIPIPHHPHKHNPPPGSVATTKTTIVLKSKEKIRINTRSSASCSCIRENKNSIFAHNSFILILLINKVNIFYDVIKRYCKYNKIIMSNRKMPINKITA